MRIAMFTLHTSPVGELGAPDTGGLSVYVREVAAHLGARGHRVDIFTGRPGPRGAGVLPLAPGVRLVCLEGAPSGDPGKLALHALVPRFAEALEAFRREEGAGYDVIHSHYWLSGCLGERVRQSWQAPHVVTFHTLGAVKNGAGCGEEEPALRLSEEEAIARSCDRVVTATEAERRFLIRSYGVPEERVAVIPCGVNQERFALQDRGHCRSRLGIASEESVLLYVGRFAPVKGVDLLLEACSRLARRWPFSLLLAGGDGPEGRETRRLEARAAELGIAARTRFLGRIPQEDLPALYGAADALVLPSHAESFGLVALEALACGTPVVATRVGAMEEVIRPGRNGVLADEPTPDALARALEAVLQRAETGQWKPATLRASVARYTWGWTADDLAALYEELLSGRHPVPHRTDRMGKDRS